MVYIGRVEAFQVTREALYDRDKWPEWLTDVTSMQLAGLVHFSDTYPTEWVVRCRGSKKIIAMPNFMFESIFLGGS